MPPIPEKEMSAYLVEESRAHSREFMVFSALNELYVYVNQNKEMIFEELNQNEFALQQGLPEKFQNMLQTMEVPPDTIIMNNGSLDNYNSKSRLMSNSNSRFYWKVHCLALEFFRICFFWMAQFSLPKKEFPIKYLQKIWFWKYPVANFFINVKRVFVRT